MRLICPSCHAQYEIEADLIPPEGRDVQCSACDNVWLQMPPQVDGPTALPPSPEMPPRQAFAIDPVEDVNVHFSTRAFEAPMGPEEDLPPEDEGDLDAQILKRHSLDESMMAVLREEAQREERARAEEAERLRKTRNLEFQTEMPAPVEDGPRLRITPRSEATMEPPLHDEPAPQPSPRREALPDIEHINSTLEAPRAYRRPTVSLQGADGARPSGFLRGFAAMLLLAVLVWALYIKAPQISASVPALEGALNAYVGVINILREGLNEIAIAVIKVLDH